MIARRLNSVLPRFQRAMSARPLVCDNPYTGETFCPVRYDTDAEIGATIDRSAHEFQSWRNVPLQTRLDTVNKWLSVFESKADKIAGDVSGMMGKPLKQAKGEVNTVLDRARTMLALAPSTLADQVIAEKVGSNLKRKITREPIGVVASLCPWNYPLICAVNSVIPAVIAGNTVLIKHSDRSPLCADHFADTMAEASGRPNLIQSLYADHAQVARAVQHPSVAYVSFTGSVAGGRAVYKAAASAQTHTFIDVGLELGGKDATYVAADADIVAAADSLVDGAMYNAGQSCCSVERVYVHRSVYKAFVDACVAEANKLKMGNPLDASTSIGPMAQPHHGAFVEAQVNQARAMGATVHTGGKRCTDASGRGRFFAPTVISDCTHHMSVMTEETFGPVIAIAVVDSEQEAVAKINDSVYGLTASVFTKDEKLADRVAKQLNVGTVFMNRCDYVDPSLPWSGRGDSGKGISLSQFGYNALTRTKGYNFRVPNLVQ